MERVERVEVGRGRDGIEGVEREVASRRGGERWRAGRRREVRRMKGDERVGGMKNN